MGSYSSALGAATFLVIFGAGNLIKHLGWKTGALATPLSMALLAAPLFAAVWGGGVPALYCYASYLYHLQHASITYSMLISLTAC
jgi:TLC ATP/ADP transporter